MSETPLHANVAGFAPFIGTFHGSGDGTYPTIEPFGYQETLTFSHRGAPVVSFHQATTSLDGSRPMHHESGFVRVGADGVVEMTVAHTFGITEVLTGEVADGVIRCRSTILGVAPNAKPVRQTRREYRLDGDTLTYRLWMSYGDHDDVLHLSGVLVRTG